MFYDILACTFMVDMKPPSCSKLFKISVCLAMQASRDLVQARTAVFRYLSKASCVCLLHEDMQPAAQPLNQVLQAISDCLAIILPVL